MTDDRLVERERRRQREETEDEDGGRWSGRKVRAVTEV